MNIVLAPDSFKGSLTALEATDIMSRAITSLDKNHNIVIKPMADGGEGTTESLLTATKGETIPIRCMGPLGEKVNTTYAIINKTTAVIECAHMAGLIEVPEEKRNPDVTTTFGIGEAIIEALDQGCTSFMIGLGGSATNDGGLGMLLALGMKAFDHKGQKVGHLGKNIHEIAKIDLSTLDQRLATIDIQIASDVDNPLCGERGASAVYGPQKGATSEQVKAYDESLEHYSDLIESSLGQSFKSIPGAGAAGGLGFALLSIGASIVSGAELLATAIKLEESIKMADVVITGEGKTDEQTLYGKAPGYVAALGKKHRVPVVLISGSLTDLDRLSDHFAGCFSIVNQPLSLKQCMKQADELLYQQTKQVVQLISSLK